MENKLDNLFRDKLSKHEETPSSQAWEQIHGQLASKRKAVWGKRMAIAASIIIIATIGFYGYRSFDTIGSSNNPQLSHSIDDKKEVISETERVEKQNEAVIINVEPATKTNEPDNQIGQVSEENNKVVEEGKSANTLAQASSKEVEAVNDEQPLVVDVVHEIQANDVALVEVIINEKEETASVDVFEEPLLAQEVSTTANTETQIAKKTYPKVRIVYKANKDSELVVSGKKTIIDKGINKFTDFSDEHLLTASRKTKLRNTKDDLLALNFGKLLNKSNKDIEN